MQVTKGTWCMREQCVPGSLSSSPAQEPGNEANSDVGRLEMDVGRTGTFLNISIFWCALQLSAHALHQRKDGLL